MTKAKQTNQIINRGEVVKMNNLKCWIIEYESHEFYNAETKESAIQMFKEDGHDEDEIIEIHD